MTRFDAVLCVTAISSAPTVQRNGSAPSAQLTGLWVDPRPALRARFVAPGGSRAVRPATEARFDVVKRDTGGFMELR